MNRVPTYEQRIARIREPEDIDRELGRAKRYAMRLRRLANRTGNHEDKLKILEDIKAAEQVLRKLRVNVYVLEDRLANERQSS